MKNWLSQEPFQVTAEIKSAYERVKKPLGCSLCGHVAAVGDTFRFIYCNCSPGVKCGNFHACSRCDTGDVEAMRKAGSASFEEAKDAAKRWGIYGPDWM